MFAKHRSRRTPAHPDVASPEHLKALQYKRNEFQSRHGAICEGNNLPLRAPPTARASICMSEFAHTEYVAMHASHFDHNQACDPCFWGICLTQAQHNAITER